MEVPEVKAVGRRTGRAELDEHAEGVHSSDIEVDLVPSARAKPDIVADIRSRLAVLPVSVNVGQPISHRLDHILSGVRAEIALKIFGEDLDTLRTTGEILREMLAAVPGIVDLQVEKQVRIPQLEIRVDYTRAALDGVQPAAVVDQLSRLSNGRAVSRVVDGYRRFDVTMRLPNHLRTTERLGDLLIETPVGWIPARQIADIRETDGPGSDPARECTPPDRRACQQRRQNRHGADRCGHSPTPDRCPSSAGILHPARRHVSTQEEASRMIAALSVLSLALIFAILFSRYRSVVLTLIIMGSVPLALIGSVAALWLAGQPLSVASMIGFITLTGIATRNGILKISHYINSARDEGLPFGHDLVVRGSLERLTPVLMTALAAGVALLPLLIDAATPGKEILHPVAVTIFGGFLDQRNATGRSAHPGAVSPFRAEIAGASRRRH